MEKRTVIVTGGNAGLGYQAAKNIAASDPNYHVVLACRSVARGEAAAETLRSETNNLNITTMQLDLASLSSVRAFSDSYDRSDLPPLYSVVCNAGISAAGVPGSARTEDGVEMIFGVNHLGHFLLTNLLLTVMSDSGRIVFVTSDLHDPPWFFPAKVDYRGATTIARAAGPGMQQYCLSKLCNIYTAHEMARLLAPTGKHITVNSFNPGAMFDTSFSVPAGNIAARAMVKVVGGVMGRLIGKSSTATESGAKLAALVTDESLANSTGLYFDRGEIVDSSPLSCNEQNARELWVSSTELSRLDPAETVFLGYPPEEASRIAG